MNFYSHFLNKVTLKYVKPIILMISRLGEKLQSLVFCINRWIRNSLNNSDLHLGQKSMNIFLNLKQNADTFKLEKKSSPIVIDLEKLKLQEQIDSARICLNLKI